MKHMIPVGDMMDHAWSVFCPCGVTVNEPKGLIYHNSFDGREIVIEAEIAMEMRCECCLFYIDREGNRTDPPPEYAEA